MSDFAKDFALLLLGVVIAQAVNFWNDRRKRKRIAKLHIEELEQIELELQRVTLAFERQLQISAKGGIEALTIIPIQTPIFTNNYKDVMTDFNKNQRISLQMIHGNIELLNAHMKSQAKLVEEIFNRTEHTADDHRLWGESALGGYMTTQITKWHIQYHLKNKSNPSLDLFDKTHQEYLQYCQRTHDYALSIKNNPLKNVERKDFEVFYNPSLFGKDGNTHGERI